MIVYEKYSLRIAEVHFEAGKAPPDADVVRYQWQQRPVPGTYSFPSYTVCLDLGLEPDELLGNMHKQTRYKIRRAEKDELSTEIDLQPGPDKLEQFCAFHNRFAEHKGIPQANQARLESMRAAGQLVLSRALDARAQTLVWLSGLRTCGGLRRITGASVRHTAEDSNLVGRANRYLHWKEILKCRELGVRIYDLGGWYAGDTDQAKLSINVFKNGFGGEVRKLHNTYDGRTWKGVMAVRLHQWRWGASG